MHNFVHYMPLQRWDVCEQAHKPPAIPVPVQIIPLPDKPYPVIPCLTDRATGRTPFELGFPICLGERIMMFVPANRDRTIDLE